MKLTIPGILISALIVASPVAFAQNTGCSDSTSKPGASVTKDDTNPTKMTKPSKKHMASYKQRHHAKTKAMSSKAQTTGSGSSMAKPEKDDTTPKPRQ